MVKNKVFVHQLFADMQKDMIVRLGAAKQRGSHPGTKGDRTELCWLDMLQAYLPKRYCAEKAFVLDSNGSISDQIDVVVFDTQYSPFLLNEKGAKYVPAESVYAVFEIKPVLNNANIVYAGKKAESVRNLLRTSAPIYHAGGKYKPRPLFPILAGLLTLDSSWKPPFGRSFEEAISSLQQKQTIDLGCALNEGGYYVSKTKIQSSRPEHALLFFFFQLLDNLQKRATVPAIELDKYWSIVK